MIEPYACGSVEVSPSTEFEDPLVQIDLSDFALDRSVGLLLPQLVSERLSGVCIHRLENDRLLVAVPKARFGVSRSIEISWGYQCELVEASPDIIELARKFIYGVLPDTADNESWAQWLLAQAGKIHEPPSYLAPLEAPDALAESILTQAGAI